MAKKFVGQEYMAATNGKGLNQQSKGNRFVARLTTTCSILITLVSVFIVAFCFAFQMCPVIGTSMMTTLNATGANTDNALTCVLGTPKYNDIVVMKIYLQNSHLINYVKAANGDAAALNRLHLTQAEAQSLINSLKSEYSESDSRGNYKFIVKRLIAKGGDQLSMRRVGSNYYLYLNGEKLNEDYLDPLVAAHNAPNFVQLWNILNTPASADVADWVTTDYHQLLVPNTDTASDGFGTPSTYQLTIPENHYFLMGDNRGAATEFARSWDSSYFGPLPISNYHSYCVDILQTSTSMPEYLWNKFVYYVCFGWAWQK